MTSTAARPVSASAVSRALTTAGLVTSHYDRRFRYDGIYVARDATGGATVHLDLTGTRHRARTAELATEILGAKGYAVEVSQDGHSLTVTRPVPVAAQTPPRS